MIKNKITSIQHDLSQLKKFTDFSFDEIAKDYITHKAVERIIEIIINESIDINQHIIVESEKGELPFNFRESFILLSELKIYSKEFAQTISQSVGLRNILVHEYQELDEQIFYHSIKQCYEQYTQYCQHILNHLSNLK